MSNVLCPFCREPWSEDNIKIEDLIASAGCPTCGDANARGKVVIRCHKCEKIMYIKEFSTKDY
jgi:hypothetical protein